MLLVPGGFGPAFGARFGLFAGARDENDRTVRLSGAVPADPRDPVRTACLTVNLERFRGHFAQIYQISAIFALRRGPTIT